MRTRAKCGSTRSRPASPHAPAPGGVRRASAHGGRASPSGSSGGTSTARHAVLDRRPRVPGTRGGQPRAARTPWPRARRAAGPPVARRGDVEIDERAGRAPRPAMRAGEYHAVRHARAPGRARGGAGASGPSPTMSSCASGRRASDGRRRAASTSRPLTGSKRATVPSTSASGSSPSAARDSGARAIAAPGTARRIHPVDDDAAPAGRRQAERRAPRAPGSPRRERPRSCGARGSARASGTGAGSPVVDAVKGMDRGRPVSRAASRP